MRRKLAKQRKEVKDIVGKGYSIYKGPEAEQGLACLKNSEETKAEHSKMTRLKNLGMPWIWQKILSQGWVFGFDDMAPGLKGFQWGEHDLTDVSRYPSFCEEAVLLRGKSKAGTAVRWSRQQMMEVWPTWCLWR